jgi:hypothetical protein
MICTPCVDDKVFPFLMIDNFYNEEELELIWEELTSMEKVGQLFTHTKGHEGVATDEEGTPRANLRRFELDRLYKDRREESNIFKVYNKITSSKVIDAYKETTAAYRTFASTNNDCTIINYYDHGDYYKEHNDVFIHSCLIFFYIRPKKFTGGDLVFTDSGTTVECLHNRMLLFPSYYLHKVTEIEMKEEDRNKGLGRYSFAHFYTYNN